MEGINSLRMDFFQNRNICSEPKNLVVGEECYVSDYDIIDEITGKPILIPCIVLRVDQSTKIEGRCYYMLAAKDSINDSQLNNMEEAGMRFYKYLENTSPLIFKIEQELNIDGTVFKSNTIK